MKKTQQEANINNIEAQVERWDLFARLVPTVFLVINITLVTTGVINFEQAFWVGLGLFAVTAVTWWFWTIYTIRHLVKTLNRASKNLQEVRSEFIAVSKDLKDIKNDN
jgi:type II secretory pathway component PulM